MYRGRIQLGNEVFVGLLCTDANKIPFAPLEAPTMDVWSSSGLVLTKALPAVDQTFITGLFGYRLFLGSLFNTGQYRVFYRYRNGSYDFMDFDTFEVVPGGDPGGAVIAMYPFRTPGANCLIQQLDGGTIVRGKNPRY
jgi:hypothetical protein